MTERDEAGRFVKGHRNIGGRPPGSRNRRTVLSELISAADERAIRQTVIRAARDGDLTAARMVWDRLYPVRSQTDEELLDELEHLEQLVARRERERSR